MQLLQGLVKHLEKRLRRLEPVPGVGGQGQAWLATLNEALQAHDTMGSQSEMVAGLMQGSLPAELQQAAMDSMSNASTARVMRHAHPPPPSPPPPLPPLTHESAGSAGQKIPHTMQSFGFCK